MRTATYALGAALLLTAAGCGETPNGKTPETGKKPNSEKTEKHVAEKTEKDIAKEFGAIVEWAKKRGLTGSPTDATDVSYDVEKTSSVISPYTAILTWDEAIGSSVTYHLRAHYAYQEGFWVFKGAEMKDEDKPWKETSLYAGRASEIAQDYYHSLPSQ